jgi:hypothetical protein
MGIKYEVIANGGSYTNKDGVEKKRWLKCGVVMETAKGLSLKLESMPVGGDGWFILSEPRTEAPRTEDHRSKFDTEIPF